MFSVHILFIIYDNFIRFIFSNSVKKKGGEGRRERKKK